LKKKLTVLALGLFLSAGCVSIYDNKVQVHPPDQVDPYGRNVLSQCTPHIYPHELIQAFTSPSSTLVVNGGPNNINNQTDFDFWWNFITPQLDQNQVVSQGFKPVIDWSKQSACFGVVNLANSCQQVKPMGDEVTTDCYNITAEVLSWYEGSNCGPANLYPVFVYIYPKSDAPMNFKVVWPTNTPVPSTPTATPTETPTPEGDDG
jgi:hypothetical protein